MISIRLCRSVAQNVCEPQSSKINTSSLPIRSNAKPELDLKTLSNELNELRDFIVRVDEFDEFCWNFELLREAEIIAHCVIPFLQTLGWSDQEFVVERKNLYVCLFSATPRNYGNSTT